MRAPPVALREWAVAVVGGLTMAFTAWGLGGVRLWSLHSLLIGGSLTFLLAMVPLPRSWNGTDGEHGNSQNLRRLIRFPLFWLSLAFMIYVLIQGLNPAWVQIKGEKGWWLRALEPVSWLPSGISASYAEMDAFRVLVSFSAASFAVCGLWVGLRRRISIVLLLWFFVMSGVAMAIVAILQKFTGADAVLWTVKSPNLHFWGTFFYRNEAVAYLILIIASSGVLYFYHFNESEQRGVSGGPHMLLFIFVTIVYTSIALALSRGGIVFGGVMTVGFFCAVLVRGLFSSQVRKSVPLMLVVCLLLGGGGYIMLRNIDVQAIKVRFSDIKETLVTADKDSRMITTKVTWEMAQEKPWYGWGAGSWRYIFPMYQKNYPKIYYLRYSSSQGGVGRKVYYYAHNDIVQFLCEYGIVGCSFLLLILIYWVGRQWSGLKGNGFSVLMLQLGMLVALAHALFDFILQNPAYWFAFNCSVCAGTKLLLLDTRRQHQ